jgi:tyrosine-protein kinase Etk/Wzc
MRHRRLITVKEEKCMNKTQNIQVQPENGDATPGGVNLLDWLAALANRKMLVLGLPVLLAACAALACFFIPNVFKASTTILPTQQRQSAAATTLNQLGGYAGTTLGALSISIPVELYISMLKSNTVVDNLIQRFDLKRGYGTESLEVAREVLARNTKITPGRDWLVLIEVEDKDAERAAQIANGYVDELLKVANKLTLTEASHRRQFYERILQLTKTKLAEAEVAQALDKRTAKRLDRGNHLAAETVSRLRAQISAKEVRLAAIQPFVNLNNQEYIRSQQEVGALNAELAKIESNNAAVRRGGAHGYIGSATDESVYDPKYYEMLYELLSKQYEAARLDEAKDSSIIEVLDKAVVPERSFKPNRLKFVLNLALLGLVIAMVWVWFFDVIRIRARLVERIRIWKLVRNQ